MLTAPVAPDRATNRRTSARAKSSRFPLSILRLSLTRAPPNRRATCDSPGDVGTKQAMLEEDAVLGRGRTHRVDRRRDAGPRLERQRGLVHEHPKAVERGGAAIPGGSHQRR